MKRRVYLLCLVFLSVAVCLLLVRLWKEPAEKRVPGREHRISQPPPDSRARQANAMEWELPERFRERGGRMYFQQCALVWYWRLADHVSAWNRDDLLAGESLSKLYDSWLANMCNLAGFYGSADESALLPIEAVLVGQLRKDMRELDLFVFESEEERVRERLEFGQKISFDPEFASTRSETIRALNNWLEMEIRNTPEAVRRRYQLRGRSSTLLSGVRSTIASRHELAPGDPRRVRLEDAMFYLRQHRKDILEDPSVKRNDVAPVLEGLLVEYLNVAATTPHHPAYKDLHNIRSLNEIEREYEKYLNTASEAELRALDAIARHIMAPEEVSATKPDCRPARQ